MSSLLRALALTCLALSLPAAAHAQTGVSDDRVSLPEGPGSLEGIGDDTSVNPNMGQMSTSVPIALPDAWGMAPAIGLSYSSGAGGSVVGLGWSLEMPSIERLTLRGVPRYTVDDEFSIGGSGQLVYVGGSEPRVYRARFEGGFVRYGWYGHGDDGAGGYWVAEYPDGKIGYFGADASGDEQAAARVGDPARGVFRYGLVTMVDVYGHHTDYTWGDTYGGGTTSLVERIAWGHDQTGAANYTVTFTYEDRTDWLSNASGGFEEVLDVRLDALDVHAYGHRIRRYDLKYDGYDTSGGFSRLAQVLLLAIDDTPYQGSSTFTYSRALGDICRDDACDRPFVQGMGTIDAVINTGDATLVDMNGDALPDIVDASIQGANHRIFLNTPQADGSFAFAAPYDSALGSQTGHDLSLTQVQVLDANGDGFTDLMNASSGDILFNTGAGDWSSMVNVWPQDASGLPTSEASLAALRFMDYDNDRKIDLIGSTGSGDSNVTTVYRNTGSGFAIDDAAEPLAAGFDEAMELNDFNGDGLLDAVHVGQNEITYQLNLGWGRWSETRTAGSFTFTAQEAEDAELEDMNGDALADLVLVGSDRVTIWVNRNGREFEDEQEITTDQVDGTIPTKGTNTVTLFADMNGNGSSDVVWITPGEEVRFLELFPVKPNLIATIDNGLGGVTTVTYGTTVEHMARAAAAGAPWAYDLPFPNVVVDSIVDVDIVSGAGTTQIFSYHDGWYDGVEKQFRGFERVEQALSGDDHKEPGEARLRYDLGVDPYDPYRAGLQLEAEALSDGRSLQVKTMTYGDCEVAGVPDSGLTYDIRYVCETAESTELREGRPSAEWAVVEKTMAYDGYGNVTLEANLGVTSVGGGACGDAGRAAGEYGAPSGAGCLGDEMYTETTYVSPDDTDGRWILHAPSRVRVYADPAGDYAETTTYYDGDDFTGLPAGELTHGFVSRVTRRIDAAGATLDETRARRDAHGNSVETLDALATTTDGDHRRTYTYSADGQLVEQVDIHLDDDDGPYSLRRTYVYDGLWDQVAVLSDWRVYRGDEAQTALHATSYAYDVFGRPVSVIQPGGDSATSPTVTYDYDLGAPSRVITRRRSAVGGEQDLFTVSCVDGHGRVYETKTRLEDGRYQVTDFTVFAEGDDTRRVYQPFVSGDDGCDLAPPDGTRFVGTYYDALGRVIRSEHPTDDGGTLSGHLDLRPLATWSYDLDDDDAASPFYDTPMAREVDGLGRTVARGRIASAGADPEWYRYTFDAVGNAYRLSDPLGNSRTQTSDLLGRVVRVDDPDRGTITLGYDALGNAVTRTDALGIVQRFEFDGAGRSSARWIEGDREATEIRFQWDLPGDCPGDVCENTANHIAAVHFPTPLGDGVEWRGYDLRGRPAAITRQVGDVTLSSRTTYDDADRAVSATLPGGRTLETVWDDAHRVMAIPGYIDSITNDDQGDVAAITFANGVTETQRFDARRQLVRWEAKDAGGASVAGLAVTRDVLGRIVSADDLATPAGGPTNDALYTWDAYGRLVEADLDLGADDEEIVTYAYDAIDNIIARESTLVGSPVDDGERALDATRPHAVARVGSTAVGYDAAGQVISRGDATLDWDGFGRVASVSEGGAVQSSYTYVDSHERVLTVSGDSVIWHLSDRFEIVDGVANLYVTLGDQSVARHEYADAATLVLSDVAPASGADDALTADPDGRIDAADAWLAYAEARGWVGFDGAARARSDADQLLAGSAALGLIDWDERVTWLHRDHVDNLVAVTDEDGAVVSRSVRYPFGMTRWASSNGDTAYGFHDERSDDAAGLVAMGARHYDPLLARWTAPDQLFEVVDDGEDTVDPWEAFCGYAFVRNSPVESQDENGAITFTDRSWKHLNIAVDYIAGRSLPDRYSPHTHDEAVKAANKLGARAVNLNQVGVFIHVNYDAIIDGIDKRMAGATKDEQAKLETMKTTVRQISDLVSLDHPYDAQWLSAPPIQTRPDFSPSKRSRQFLNRNIPKVNANALLGSALGNDANVEIKGGVLADSHVGVQRVRRRGQGVDNGRANNNNGGGGGGGANNNPTPVPGRNRANAGHN